MSLTVSTPVKILALAGILGALALGAGFTLLGKSAGSETAPPAIEPLHPRHTTPAPAPATAKPAAAPAKHGAASAAKKPLTHAARKAPAHPAVRPAAHAAAPKAKPRPAAVEPVAQPLPQNGLPAVVNRALRSHAVVVVSLYDPQADVDAASVGEAQAGAELAGAGFVPLDVLSQSQAAPLARKLGVLPDPALLVFRAPGELVFRVDGFADRDTVAQAVANALPADAGPLDWRIQANQICAAAGTDPAQLNALRGLNVPKPAAAQYTHFLSTYSKLLTGPPARRGSSRAAVARAGAALGLSDCTGAPKPKP